MKKIILIIGGLALVVGGVAVVMSTSEKPQATQTPQTTEMDMSSVSNEVTIKDYAFEPATIKVKQGTKVTWTNQDDAMHNVVAVDAAPTGGPNGPLLAKGESYSFTFDTVGKFDYLCEPHPYMTGSVEVVE